MKLTDGGRVFFLRLIFMISLVFLHPVLALADFDAGQKAYDAKDYAAAYRYWQVSADQGDPQSQLGLAQLYLAGRGVQKDKIVAYLYFALASDQNIVEAGKQKEKLAERFTDEEVQLAETLKDSWEPILPAETEATVTDEIARLEQQWFAAAEAGDAPVIKEMVEAGFDINSQDVDGWTALMLAALNSHTSVAGFLIESGADQKITDGLGMTALMAASVAGDADLVKLMVKTGANVDQVDSAGQNAEYMAEEAGHVSIARYFSGIELPEEDIQKAQELLIVLGYLEGTADGKSGPKTMAAVKAFQEDSGLKPNGMIRQILMETLTDKVTSLEASSPEENGITTVEAGSEEILATGAIE
ncbi:ankyrin repeat domain-containing protein [Kiloniella laminariae]|uniref:Ankyrin repeat domain-containing protein n=1 Tax=Kiloniella laminariae TaxID=454162 RepID=A0ABT4LEG7_9PROT|nr:ankyrin repeat domain-containing protein [Kiloniella laminariae]MCZ4279493.1 ankyrin repeat domain-containing protein [Kiloniella laminariae]